MVMGEYTAPKREIELNALSAVLRHQCLIYHHSKLIICPPQQVFDTLSRRFEQIELREV
jgi:hypothetical protein